MIGATSRGGSFGGLSGYLLLGSDRRSPERVGFVEMRNMPTDDPLVASKVMTATAAQSKRVKKPVYHAIISWHEDDKPTAEQMITIMDRALADIGLGDHQALYVAHTDTDHPHLHAMVNRVSLETGRAWAGKSDHHQLRDSLIRQEREHGFRETPKKRDTAERQEMKRELAPDPKPIEHVPERGPEREAPAPAQAPEAPPAGPDIVVQLDDTGEDGRHMDKEDQLKLREGLRHTFETATSWGDLDGRLSRRDLRLEVSGNGLRIYRRGRFVKLSEVLPPKLSAKALKNRLGDLKEYIEEKQRREDRLIRKRPRDRNRDRDADRDR